MPMCILDLMCRSGREGTIGSCESGFRIWCHTLSFPIEFCKLILPHTFHISHIEFHKTSPFQCLREQGYAIFDQEYCLLVTVSLQSSFPHTFMDQVSSLKKNLCSISYQMLRDCSFTQVATTVSAFNDRMVQLLLLSSYTYI